MPNKVYKEVDGEKCVAVLYSPGYGAGWYTWHYVEELLYDAEVVKIVEKMMGIEEKYLDAKKRGDLGATFALKGSYETLVERVEKYVQENYDKDGSDIYIGGASQLTIAWVPVGQKFRITEYDGSESIQYPENEEWMTA
jgi:hypothetical protein